MTRGSQPSSTRHRFKVPHHQRGAAAVLSLSRQRTAISEPQLIVTQWPDAIDPLAIAPLSGSGLTLLKPGFAVWHRSSLVIPYHPQARIEHRAGQAALYVAGQLIAHGSAPDAFTDDQCMVGIVDRSLLPPWSEEPAELFLSLLELGKARIADVPISDWRPCDATQRKFNRTESAKAPSK